MHTNVQVVWIISFIISASPFLIDSKSAKWNASIFDFKRSGFGIWDFFQIFERAVMFQLKNSNYKLDALLHFEQNGNFRQKFLEFSIFSRTLQKTPSPSFKIFNDFEHFWLKERKFTKF